MSHQATNWAIQQRGLKPATKILLWHLADCHNPAHGCFPSQGYLADHCEMTAKTVRAHLERLEELGLISRVKTKTSGLFAHTEYTLNFDLILSPSVKITHGKNDTSPSVKITGTQGKNLPTNPVIDNPVKEPVNINPLPPLHIQEVFDRYNEAASQAGWPQCQKVSKARISKMKKRLDECGGIEGWVIALAKAQASDFLCNRTRASFNATIDFFLQESSFTKLMEGNYDNRDNGSWPNGSGPSGTPSGGASRPGRGTAEAAIAVAQKLRADKERGSDDADLPWQAR